MAEPGNNPERASRILDAAARLIVHYGFDKTTMGEIAAAAGISKGAIYLHWPSKDELFAALLLREMQDFSREWIERVMADPNGGKLGAMFLHSLDVLARRPLLRALVSSDRRVLGDFLQRYDPSLFARRMTLNQDFIRLLQAAGAVRADVDPQTIGYILACLRYGYLLLPDLAPPEHTPPVEAVIEALADFLERALAPAGGGDSEAGKQIVRQLMAGVMQQWEQGKLA